MPHADVIAQAKSGTGKTIVFTVALLESVNTALDAIQVQCRESCVSFLYLCVRARASRVCSCARFMCFT